MKCGIGKCGRCNIGSKYVCKDGPVFRFDQLDELPDVTGTNGYDEVFTTDANGEIIIENLRIDGEYVVSEVSDEKNADYILPEDKTAAVIEGSVTIVEMHNERKPEPEPEAQPEPEAEPETEPEEEPEPEPEAEPEVLSADEPTEAAAEEAVTNLEANQTRENVDDAKNMVNAVADSAKKEAFNNRINAVASAIDAKEAEAARQAEEARKAEEARQAQEQAAAEAARQAQEQAAAAAQQAQQQEQAAGGYKRDYRGRWHRPNGQYASKAEIAAAGLPW